MKSYWPHKADEMVDDQCRKIFSLTHYKRRCKASKINRATDLVPHCHIKLCIVKSSFAYKVP